ncbi:hypothetical protein VTK73DRAFT_175 [Phialemonium thermophilum]|uniref:Uncharacterized protein n=1 Tax=Phialemonium thermophilum TaxID=223376 RepID=A0ABR3VWL0_9PEZI
MEPARKGTRWTVWWKATCRQSTMRSLSASGASAKHRMRLEWVGGKRRSQWDRAQALHDDVRGLEIDIPRRLYVSTCTVRPGRVSRLADPARAGRRILLPCSGVVSPGHGGAEDAQDRGRLPRPLAGANPIGGISHVSLIRCAPGLPLRNGTRATRDLAALDTLFSSLVLAVALVLSDSVRRLRRAASERTRIEQETSLLLISASASSFDGKRLHFGRVDRSRHPRNVPSDE